MQAFPSMSSSPQRLSLGFGLQFEDLYGRDGLVQADAAASLDGRALEAQVAALLGGSFDELRFAEKILEWQKDEPANADALALAERFSAWAAHTEEGRRRHRDGVLFKPAQRVDPMH